MQSGWKRRSGTWLSSTGGPTLVEASQAHSSSRRASKWNGGGYEDNVKSVSHLLYSADAFSVQCRNCHRIGNQIDITVLVWCQVQILDCHCIKYTIDHAIALRLFSLGTKTIGETHSVWAGSKKSMASIRFNAYFSILSPLGLDCIKLIVLDCYHSLKGGLGAASPLSN